MIILSAFNNSHDFLSVEHGRYFKVSFLVHILCTDERYKRCQWSGNLLKILPFLLYLPLNGAY